MYKQHEFNHKEMQHFYSQLNNDGYLYIDDLPDDFEHFNFSQEFGKLTPQYDGGIIWSIKADPKYDDHYHSLNTKKLSPHTECYEFEGLPPKYLALWCKQPASCNGGQTTLFDAHSFLSSLQDNDLAVVKSQKVSFVSSSGIQSSALGRNAKHPLISDEVNDNGRDLVRFSRNCMQTESSVINKVADDLVDTFEEDHVSVTWSKNAFLIWDNHRMLHSRTSFQDKKRELRRVWLVPKRV